LILYFASTNPGKLAEFRHGTATIGVVVEPVPNIRALPACTEDGLTFEANARKKALHYSRHTDGLVFADDSGLCVEALGSAPGIYSARFAGPHANDKDNNRKLLHEMKGAVSPVGMCAPRSAPVSRSAHFICVIALAERGRILTTVEGRADGIILETPRGENGFGYDPLFFFTPLNKTFSELNPEEKFRVSHRGEAFRKLLEYLKQY
jgi:XTP/dITP diphosphohydrolase